MIKKIQRLLLFMFSLIIYSSTDISATPLIANNTKLLEKIVQITQMLQKQTPSQLPNIIEITKLLAIQQKKEHKVRHLLKKKIHTKKRNKIEVQFVQFYVNEFDSEGYPTPEGLKRLLILTYFPKHQESITVEKFKGGGINEAVYRVFDKKNKTKSIFFLKISPSSKIDSEATRLEALQAGPVGRLGMDTFYYPNSRTIIPKKKLPQLVWVEKFWVYKNQKNEEITIEVTHAAHGSLVYEIFNSQDQELKNKCCDAVATALATFQQAFMVCTDPYVVNSWKTMGHGDLHTANMLFDPKTSRVYFIDNGTMKPNHNIFYDVLKTVKFIPKELKLRFWNAYIAAYPKNKEQFLFNRLFVYITKAMMAI